MEHHLWASGPLSQQRPFYPSLSHTKERRVPSPLTRPRADCPAAGTWTLQGCEVGLGAALPGGVPGPSGEQSQGCRRAAQNLNRPGQCRRSWPAWDSWQEGGTPILKVRTERRPWGTCLLSTQVGTRQGHNPVPAELSPLCPQALGQGPGGRG